MSDERREAAKERALGRRPTSSDLAADYDRLCWAFEAGQAAQAARVGTELQEAAEEVLDYKNDYPTDLGTNAGWNRAFDRLSAALSTTDKEAANG